MRSSGILLLLFLLANFGLAQSVRPKPQTTKGKAPTTKSIDDKKKAQAKQKKPEPKGQTKAKPSTARSTQPAPKASATKPKPASKPKPVAQREEPVISDEELESAFKKAAAVETAAERITALKKFISVYPKSKWVQDASAIIVTTHTQIANEMMVSGDLLAALESYEHAVEDAPRPMPDQLFSDTLAKFAPNLFFRGARGESFHIAGLIEKKVSNSVSQLLGIANFYMSIENGSEARRIANRAIKLDPASSLAYQSLGLASRMDFLLEESAAAYVKAVELDPESLTARRGLAEMRRALGQPEDAVLLYKSVVEKDPADLASGTGLILALFESNKRDEAETELARSLEANPGNVILQASAAYWYATNGEGEKAVDLAQKAIATDPRFIWSHIALARGQIAQGEPVKAERTLIAARRYGNFPTIDYEIASARAAAGLYREAAEELSKSFKVKDGLVYTKLGGRVERGVKNLAELVGFERRASIFSPVPSDPLEVGAQMTALLEFKQELEKTEPDTAVLGKAADEFSAGGDKMKVHRLVFAASQLLDRKLALPKVVELTKAAPGVLEAGLEAPDPTAAVLASELYESRAIASARGQYLNVPPVPRSTLSSVLRGRVEELSGWAYFQMDAAEQASVHLRRAVSVLPVDSAWWRTSTWRLGTSLAVEGKNSEALDMYVRSYKSGQPDAMKYSVIEALYRRVNGHTLGLEQRIGPNPSPTPSVQAVAQKNQNTPLIPLAADRSSPILEAVASQAKPTPTATPKSVTEKEVDAEILKTASSPTPEASPKPTEIQEPTPEPTATPAAPTPSPSASPTSSPETAESKIDPALKAEESSTPAATPSPEPSPLSPKQETQPLPTPEPSPSSKTPAAMVVAKDGAPATRLADSSNGLFPPVVISIPQPPRSITKDDPSSKDLSLEQKERDPKVISKKEEPSSPQSNPPLDGRERVVLGAVATTEAIQPCSLTLDQETISLQSSGSERAVVVRRTDDGDVDAMTGTSLSPDDVSIRREPLPGVRWTTLFILRSVSAKKGAYRVRFETPCGKKEVSVNVQ